MGGAESSNKTMFQGKPLSRATLLIFHVSLAACWYTCQASLHDVACLQIRYSLLLGIVAKFTSRKMTFYERRILK